MDGEERKVGGKKRLKGDEIGRVSDDDEPIGALFKVKSKMKLRKGKLGLDVKKEGYEAVGEDDGGMDDTLACFKKKLKGLKKDSGVGTALENDMDLDEVESVCVAPKEVDKDTEEHGDIHSDVKIRKQRRVGKPKSSLKVPNLRAHDGMEKKVEPEALSLESSDGNLEDSLSTFFKKGQSGTLKKSLTTCSRRRGEIQGSDGEVLSY